MEANVQGSDTFIEEICAIPGGEKIRLCIQCGTCSGSCPNIGKMDHTLRELIAMARAGLREDVLSSNMMWFCMSCYMCTVRCPRGVKPTDLWHALECLAIREHLNNPATHTPAMYQSFSDFVYNNGRLSEVGFMARFYIRTKVNPLNMLHMAPIAIGLMSHGRMPIRARGLSPEARGQLRAILDQAKALGGVS